MDYELSTWTIFDNPEDFPGFFVARRFSVKGGKVISTQDALYGQTLQEVRDKLPQGLYCMGRHPTDTPSTVETWI